MSHFVNKIFGGKPNKKNKGPVGDIRVSDIGAPFSVKHNVHVGYNPETGKIEGLPKPWLELLQQANITKTEQSANPKAVIDALKVYTYSVRKKTQKFITTQPTIDHEIQEIEDAWTNKGTNKSDSDSNSNRESLTDDLEISDITNANTNYYANVNVQGQTDKKPNNLITDAKKRLDNLKINDKKQLNEGSSLGNTQNGETSGAPIPMRRKKNEQKVKKYSEEEVMDELRKIVNPGNPKVRFTIIKKVGSGASGTVFTAVDNESQEKVAIKTMDLSQQPKKELIITEIKVMKDNR